MRVGITPVLGAPGFVSLNRPPWQMGSMMFKKRLSLLGMDEDGAVTVDWVVLTAAVVILAIGAITVLDQAIENLAGEISLELVWSNISGSF